MCCEVIYLGQVWLVWQLLSGQVFLTNNVCQKGRYKVGVWKKCCAHTFWMLLFGPSWRPFLCCTKFGADINTHFAPDNNCFAFFCPWKMCWNTYVIVFLNINQMCPKMGFPKTITFQILQNTGYKKPFCCNPQLDQKCVCFNLSFLKDKNIDVDQKTHTHTLRQGKTKIK